MCWNCNASVAERRAFLRSILAMGAGAALAGCWHGPDIPPIVTAPPEAPAPDLGVALFPDALGRPLATNKDCPVLVMPRAIWTPARPDLSRIKLMNGINRLTVHHSAFNLTTTGWTPTKEEIEYIRQFHTGTAPTDRNWADIAYHYLVDRAGRVWQGRPLVYQGAHVRNHNEHNIGIVLLGDFDRHEVGADQSNALVRFMGFLRKLYAVPAKAVFTHQELADNNTDCPGTHLELFMNRLRAQWT